MPMSLQEVTVAAGENLPGCFTAQNLPGKINLRVLNVATTATTEIYTPANGPKGMLVMPRCKTVRVLTEPSDATGEIRVLNGKSTAESELLEMMNVKF